MLSSLLLRSTLDKKERVNQDPIIAKKIDLNIRTIAQVGCGKASCSYSIDKDEQCLVFCVSSLLAHRDSTRQHLRVTKCQVLSTELTGKQNCLTFSVSKLTTSDGALPTLALTKELHASTLTLHAGAISAEDLLLHLGEVKAGTMLEIRLEFVLKFTLPSSPDSLQYVFTNKLPTHHLCYNVSLAATLPIEDVTPLHISSDSDDFRWNYLAGPCVVEILYECKQYSDKATGLKVQLATAPSPSSCCSISYPQDATKTRGGCKKPDFNLRCDGLMMLNSCLTPNVFPASVKDKKLHPSEFIFVVDCSGSMSGSNIQSASDTLITCIKSLPTGSYFNVIAFGSNFRHLFHTSSEYTKWSVEKAIKFANEIQATLGGTELLDPLRWIFKQGKCGSLARQIFIVTDGGVNNTAHVLHTVRKNRHQARCHTFGIGPDVCTELVTGIAAASGGRCVLLRNTERLQTKVMEVLRDSLEPYVSDSSLQWSPPEGFSLLETTPTSLGTVYSGSTHTAFALIKREGAPRLAGVLESTVSIVGQSGEDRVTMEVEPAPLPNLTPTQSYELASILDRVATWSKLQEMEMNLTSSSRKNSQNDNDKTQEPEPKRIKLNGSSLNGKMVDSELCDELIELSLSSGIPCGLTCFRGCGLVQQLLPPKPPTITSHTLTAKKTSSYSQKRLDQLRKMQSRNRKRQVGPLTTSAQPTTMCSMAINTFTTLGTTLKTMASSIGLVLPDPIEVHNGHRIDDHLQYHSQKKTTLHWDDTKGKLVYPSFYRTPVTNGTNGVKTPYVHSNGHRTTPSSESSSDDEDFISDTDSNSSMDPDWDDLRRPSELRPLIQMQLYSGAWPMVRPFSYAVGVPLDEVRKLIEKETKKSAVTGSEEESEKSNIWTTALAISCLEEYFPQFRAEWEVVGMKGQQWIEDNLCQETDMSAQEVYQVSRSLVARWR